GGGRRQALRDGGTRRRRPHQDRIGPRPAAPPPRLVVNVSSKAILMDLSRPSRRQVLGASIIGVAVFLAPLGSRAFASLFEEQLLTRPAWNDGVLKYRIDGTSKVMGEKVFARDIRARDMPHWPQQQSHALVLRATMRIAAMPASIS